MYRFNDKVFVQVRCSLSMSKFNVIVKSVTKNCQVQSPTSVFRFNVLDLSGIL